MRGRVSPLVFLRMARLPVLFFTFSLFWASVRADYTIDDSDYSVLKFSENPAGPVWGPFGSDTGEVLELRLPNGTMQTVDATKCFDGTYTYAACSASNNCAVQFSFTGSGITIYVLQAGPQGMSASLSIDSGATTTATLDAPPSPQYYISHVSLFNVQNMPSGTHTAVMKVLDWNGGFSGMMLDYINVNQAQVSSPSPSPGPSPTPSPTPTPSSTPAPSSSNSQTASQANSIGTQASSVASSAVVLSFFSSQSGVSAFPSSTTGNSSNSAVSPSAPKKLNIAAVVVGVIGGVGGLLALIALAFFCIRRRHHRRLQALNERPSPLFLPHPEARFTDVGMDPFASSSALAATAASRPLQSWTDSEAGSAPLANAVPPRDASNASPMTNLSHARGASSGTDSATSSVPLSIGVVAAGAVAGAASRDQNATAGPSSYPNEKAGPSPGSSAAQPDQDHRDSSAPDAVLTDDQVDFVNSLFRNNVPAPVVARVLERMLANPQGASTNTGYDDPELRSHLDPSLSVTQAPVGGVPWRPTMSDLGDGETTVGTGTAPPSYDYAQAQ